MPQKQTCPSEHIEQREFVSWFRKNHDARIFAIPNGGLRNKAVAMKLKVEGVTSGVPDLFIPEWKLWIEMKRQFGSTTSKEQKDWGAYLGECGYTWMVCKGNAQAQEFVNYFKKNVFSS